MRQVNIHDAKTHLSQLVDAVEKGEQIVLARAGKPVALLSPLPPKAVRRRGLLKGKIHLGPDFDAPMPEWLLRAFEGDDE